MQSSSDNSSDAIIYEPPKKIAKGQRTWELIPTAAFELSLYADVEDLIFYEGEKFIRLVSSKTGRSVTIEDQPSHLNLVFFNNRNERVEAKSLIKKAWYSAMNVEITRILREFFASQAERKVGRNPLQPLCEEKCCRHLAAVNLFLPPWSLAERRIFEQITLECSKKRLLSERFYGVNGEVRVRIHNYWQFMLLIDRGDKLIIRYFDMRRDPGTRSPDELMKTPFNWRATLDVIDTEMHRFFRN